MLDCGGSAALPLRRREMYLESSLTKCQPVSSSIHSTDAYYYESDSLWKGWKANQDFWPQSAHLSVKKKKKKRKKNHDCSLSGFGSCSGLSAQSCSSQEKCKLSVADGDENRARGRGNAASGSLKALASFSQEGNWASRRVLQSFLKKLPPEGSGKLTWFQHARLSLKNLRGDGL